MRDIVWNMHVPQRPRLVWLIAPLLGLAISADKNCSAQLPPPPEFSADRVSHLVGAASCAASNCHGGVTVPDSGPTFAAYRLWLTTDKHSQAYAALLEPRSQEMIRQLGSGWELPAHKEQRCLVCHAHVATPAEPQSPTFDLADGVSCEVCHGPAQHWLRDHSRPALWSSLTVAEKAERGFRETADFTARAELCVRCHIGADDREVNHDLIAAGHPRLNFEFAAYSALHKKHWHVTDDHARAGGAAHATQSLLDAQLWLVGQTVATRQAITLTRTRALRALNAAGDTPAPWPELSEYSCYSCHHDLQDQGYRQYAPLARRAKGASAHWDDDPPGTYAWQSWLLAQAPERPGVAPEFQDQLRGVRQEIRRPIPSPDLVVERCDAVLGGAAFPAVPARILTPEELRTLLEWATRDAGRFARDWDTAAQSYLTLVSLIAARQQVQAASGAMDSEQTQRLRELLVELRRHLQFPAGANSPVSFGADDIARIEVLIQSLRSELSLRE